MLTFFDIEIEFSTFLEYVPGAASRDADNEVTEAPMDEYGAKDYRSEMTLKPDHASRPIWIVRTLVF